MSKKLLIVVVVIAVMALGVGSGFAFEGGPRLEEKKDILEERVAEGDMTQEEADVIIAEITACAEDCDGTGDCENRPEDGRGIFGTGDGTGFGRGQGRGACGGDRNGDGVVDENDTGFGRGCGRFN